MVWLDLMINNYAATVSAAASWPIALILTHVSHTFCIICFPEQHEHFLPINVTHYLKEIIISQRTSIMH